MLVKRVTHNDCEVAMEYRFKVEIEFDKDKVLSEGKYELSDIYDGIRETFVGDGFPEVTRTNDTLTFIGVNKKDFSKMWVSIFSLYDAVWFKPYVTKLLWYNKDFGDEYYEDVLESTEDFTRKYGA